MSEYDDLTFESLRVANALRCPEFGHGIEGWSETDWACAAAGEMGELCNLIKKRRRGEAIDIREIADEMADVVTYLDLLAERMGIDLGHAVRLKFNEVSGRIGSDVDLMTRGEIERAMTHPHPHPNTKGSR